MEKSLLNPDALQHLRVLEAISRLNTAIPGQILAWDAAKCLATVQPLVMTTTTTTGVDSTTVTNWPMPPIEGVPACLPHSVAAGLFITVPIQPGDPCLIIFSQRAIAQIVATGRMQPPFVGAVAAGVDTSDAGEDLATANPRQYDYNDAMFIPGLMLMPNAIQNWAQNAIEIRNRDGSVKVSVGPDKTYITGDLEVSGTVNAGADVTTNGISLKGHVHSGVQSGSSTTGGPQ